MKYTPHKPVTLPVLISFTQGHVAGPSNLRLKALLISSRHAKGKGENTTVSGMPERPLSWALNRSFLFYLHFIIMQRNYENVINLSFSSLICHSWRSTRERSVPWHWWWVVISQFFQKQPLLCIMKLHSLSGPWSRCSVLSVTPS